MTSLINLEGIELQLYTDDEIRKLAVVQVSNCSTYDRGLPKANGVNDPRMGVTDKALQCPTCGLTATCNNHFGFIELERPVLRLGHIASVLCLLRSVCWACSKLSWSISTASIEILFFCTTCKLNKPVPVPISKSLLTLFCSR